MAALIRQLRPGLGLVSRFKKPALINMPCFSYSSTSNKVDQSSEFVIGERTKIDPKRVKEIIEEGKRTYDNQNDPDSPDYVTWGFVAKDNHLDLLTKRLIFFIGFSLLCVISPLYLHYLPDKHRREWANREAVMLLQQRRDQGLLLIDPDFIPQDKILLNPEE